MFIPVYPISFGLVAFCSFVALVIYGIAWVFCKDNTEKMRRLKNFNGSTIIFIISFVLTCVTVYLTNLSMRGMSF